MRVSRGTQALLLISWQAGGEQGANHYLAGTPPFSLNNYRGWLPAVAQLDGSFDAERIAR